MRRNLDPAPNKRNYVAETPSDSMNATSEPEHRPSFEEFANFIRDWACIPRRKQITPETLFEHDLGITGDDGCDLLQETERRFGVQLSSPEDGCRRTFGLGPNEFLFHSEGSWPDFLSPLSSPPPVIRRFTVGELFDAVRGAPMVTREPPRNSGHGPDQ